MFVLKRTDLDEYYTQSQRVQGVWTDDIDKAKVYLTENPCKQQKGYMDHTGKSKYGYYGSPWKCPMEVVEVKLVEK